MESNLATPKPLTDDRWKHHDIAGVVRKAERRTIEGPLIRGIAFDRLETLLSARHETTW